MQYKKRVAIDKIAKIIFKSTGYLVLALLGGIFFMLLYNAIAFFLEVSPLDFITGSQWNPTAAEPAYGILPLIVSTSIVSLGAMLIAIPLGVGTAAFISEYASPKLKTILKPAIEMLAAIPSVVIGFLGIVLVGPGIADLNNLPNGLNALNGAILLAIMALPTIITISEDAIHAVPQTYREASYGLGASRWQTLRKITIPAAAPGIIAAVMLGLGRAIGETMTVLMATGNAAIFPKGFFDSVKTITATIAIEMGEVPYQTTHYYALFAIAIVLFFMTLVANLIGEYFINRFRKYHAA
ncbi:Phosphate transport system permease protein PstC [compost metagenome]|jgi:phosphate transport system permease protein|uniref:Phosphate transport system permease protein n=1 Tax=Sphingobacterium detergens TaxID=1145106 RepID=A0A420ADU4_SPHD1|nr:MULTISPECIES: phosphate ABC transporter permease subunit PstC [Sphingobacterium]MCS4227485.1 phosphate transport system permease protein [Sphingobacterium sp. BIGb0165]MDF2475799.1 phosphate transporter permease [Sphingobacterium sp.]RKE42615.1 phosphate ABC transporter membrane protein 1 (PhoT family) [Sphingobacterium detergens]